MFIFRIFILRYFKNQDSFLSLLNSVRTVMTCLFLEMYRQCGLSTNLGVLHRKYCQYKINLFVRNLRENVNKSMTTIMLQQCFYKICRFSSISKRRITSCQYKRNKMIETDPNFSRTSFVVCRCLDNVVALC